jgi:hypothetical protein
MIGKTPYTWKMAAPPPELKQGQQHKPQRSCESERSSERFTPLFPEANAGNAGPLASPTPFGPVEFSRHFARNADIASAHFEANNTCPANGDRPLCARSCRCRQTWIGMPRTPKGLIKPARRALGAYPLNDAALSKRRNRSRVIA